MKTAIIGLGRMGVLRKNWVQRQEGLRLTALCDLASPPQAPLEDAAFYTDWRELLECEKPELVFVCTYNDAIADVVCAALEHGSHVFAEKPPGRNLADTLRMKAALDRAPGRILKFGFNHRWHNSVLEAISLLESGRLGRVVVARGVYGKAGSPEAAGWQWRNDPAKAGGGILLDQGIHMLDLLLYFMGDLHLVKSLVANYVWKDLPLEDNAMALLSTPDGRAALFHSSTTQWRHLFRLELLCEDGYVHLEGLNTGSRSYGEETVRIGYKELNPSLGRFGMPGERIYYFTTDDSWQLEMEEFLEAVDGGAPLRHGTIDDAIRLMRLVEEIYHTI
jgi:predicted dehydrogenase